MKKEVDLIPNDKKVLNTISNMKEQLEKSWIFIHENVYRNLSKSCDSYTRHNSVNDMEIAFMKWEAKKDKSEIVILVEIPKHTWGRIKSISVGNKSGVTLPDNPKYIRFVKLED